jgi:hypothetical protein
MKNKNIKHGLSKTLAYSSWEMMKCRCYSKCNYSQKKYQKRGIIVCDRWLNSFENFYEDMGERPSKEYSIERRNNDGDYCPENCYWATPKEQANNTTRNIFIEWNNKKQTLAMWADELNIIPNTLFGRIYRLGWSVEKAFTTPVQKRTIK